MNDLTVILPEQIDYLIKLRNGKSNYGYAAHKIAQLKEPIENFKEDIYKIRGFTKLHTRLRMKS